METKSNGGNTWDARIIQPVVVVHGTYLCVPGYAYDAPAAHDEHTSTIRQYQVSKYADMLYCRIVQLKPLNNYLCIVR